MRIKPLSSWKQKQTQKQVLPPTPTKKWYEGWFVSLLFGFLTQVFIAGLSAGFGLGATRINDSYFKKPVAYESTGVIRVKNKEYKIEITTQEKTQEKEGGNKK